MTFVFFIYADIQWGDDATIGFSAGKGDNRVFDVPGSRTNQALNIDEGSNVNLTGVYIYRVDCSVLGPRHGEASKLCINYWCLLFVEKFAGRVVWAWYLLSSL